ncbi:MAG: GatB/YqeY domain-containing protein [Desulfobacterales bacterium]
MATIQERMKQDLAKAMKEKDTELKNTIRIVMGEFGRAEKKQLDDAEVVKILQKLVKSERESLQHSGKNVSESRYIQILESYLPRMATDDEIRQWIAENIDFSQYKNKMQAMRDIMAHFGPLAEGGRVKKILEEM